MPADGTIDILIAKAYCGKCTPLAIKGQTPQKWGVVFRFGTIDAFLCLECLAELIEIGKEQKAKHEND